MSTQPPQDKYSTLRGIAQLLSGVGWLLSVGSISVFLLAVVLFNIFPLTPRQPEPISTILKAGPILIGVILLGFVFNGVGCIAAGESINLFLDTEANTRKTTEATITLIADVRDLKEILNRMDFYLQRTANASEKLAGTVAPPPVKSR